jgi:hypothetical protein
VLSCNPCYPEVSSLMWFIFFADLQLKSWSRCSLVFW